MNLYYVLGENHTYYSSDEYEPPESCCVCDLVLAKSRGQARYLAVLEHTNHCYLPFIEETWKHTWLLARRPKEINARIVTNDHKWAAAWRLVDCAYRKRGLQ